MQMNPSNIKKNIYITWSSVDAAETTPNLTQSLSRETLKQKQAEVTSERKTNKLQI